MSEQKISKSECRQNDWFHFADDMQEMFDDDGESDWCYECGNEGVIITCCDDLCVGAGSCMHGDGEIPCPECDGGY